MTTTRRIALLAIALGMIAAPAYAADHADVAAAKAEGSVVWYTSTPIQQANKIVKLFEDRYGIKVELFRTGGSQVLRRFLQETQAGRFLTDVMTTSDPGAVAELADRNMFVPFKPADAAAIPVALQDPQGRFIAQRINVIGFYGRSDMVSEADMPKTWADLTLPKYKGKLVTTDPSFTVLQLCVVGMLSKDLGWDYFKKVSANGTMIVRGGQQTFDAVKRGERPIAAGSDISYATGGILAGVPLRIVLPSDGTFVIPAPTAVVKGSPHPNAAKLLAEFMLTKEAQSVFPDNGNYAARADLPAPSGSTPLNAIKVKPVDYAFLKAHGSAIKRQFSEIFQ
jgi:iron(III) transport system substrate-binding protein